MGFGGEVSFVAFAGPVCCAFISAGLAAGISGVDACGVSAAVVRPLTASAAGAATGSDSAFALRGAAAGFETAGFTAAAALSGRFAFAIVGLPDSTATGFPETAGFAETEGLATAPSAAAFTGAGCAFASVFAASVFAASFCATGFFARAVDRVSVPVDRAVAPRFRANFGLAVAFDDVFVTFLRAAMPKVSRNARQASPPSAHGQ